MLRAAARAAASHTGTLATRDEVYDAAFRRAGMLRVLSMEDLFGALETLSSVVPQRGDRLAIVTNGGGIGVMATDALADEGCELPPLSEHAVSALNRVLPSTWSRGNPVNIIGDADGERYAAALDVLLNDAETDAVLVLNCPTAVASSEQAARAVVDARAGAPKKTLLTSWVGESQAQASRTIFRQHRIPTYQSPEDAAKAFAYMERYRRNQQMLLQTPPSLPEQFVADSETAKSCIHHALAQGREWLLEVEAKHVIQAYGIDTVPTHRAGTPRDVAALAREVAQPLAIKIVSDDIPHKSDVGGVALNVEPDMARVAAEAMLTHVRQVRPRARLDGFSVQPMVSRRHAMELIAGMTSDRQFGPVLLFGRGGTAVEIHDDTAVGLPPLNLKLAHELIASTRVYRLLQGYRNVPPVDLDAVALTLVRLSQLIVDVAEIQELDINPLLAHAEGVTALDARIKVGSADRTGRERLAIRPYPNELEERVALRSGNELLLRPIVPEDEGPLRDGFSRLTPQEVRYRFFIPMKLLDHVTAARFSQIDYDRQMALVLVEPGIPGHSAIYGVVRLAETPDRDLAEFAIIIEQSMSGQGLGKRMMRKIIDYARERSIGQLIGDVLTENARMRGLCATLGFIERTDPDDRSVVRVTLDLSR